MPIECLRFGKDISTISAPNDLYENLVFDVCEGSRKVATGIIKSKRENIDI